MYWLTSQLPHFWTITIILHLGTVPACWLLFKSALTPSAKTEFELCILWENSRPRAREWTMFEGPGPTVNEVDTQCAIPIAHYLSKGLIFSFPPFSSATCEKNSGRIRNPKICYRLTGKAVIARLSESASESSYKVTRIGTILAVDTLIRDRARIILGCV